MTESSEIRSYLAAGADTSVSVAELAALWQMTRVTVCCTGAGHLASHPKLPARIRGAWLTALWQTASQQAQSGAPCPWSPPCAYDLFHNTQGTFRGGMDFPKPFVIEVGRLGADLLVDLTLFGVAGDWAGEAADGLVHGLRSGVDIQGTRRPLDIGDRKIARANGVPLVDLCQGAILRFDTPVLVRAGDEPHARPASLLKSLSNRISGLALWHGVTLAADSETLDAEAEALGAHAEWHVAGRPAPPKARHSASGYARPDVTVGLLGDLWIPAPSPLFMALLALGQTAHAGGRAALGLGRYRLLAPAHIGTAIAQE